MPYFIYIGASFAPFAVGAVVFYRLTAKVLKEERERGGKEQNYFFGVGAGLRRI